MQEQLHADLITQFYSAFQRRDYLSMQTCYSDAATFSDPVFPNLQSREVKAMWQMFCQSGSDLRIEFDEVKGTASGGSAKWTATYTFSPTGREVVNTIQADFVIRQGQIIAHVDKFNFHRWATQAFGFSGKLLGWTGFFRQKVRTTARRKLDAFVAKAT